MRTRTTRVLTVGAALLATLTATAPAHALEQAEASATSTPWAASWAAAEQYPRQPFWPNDWSKAGFQDQTLRQVIRLSSGGSRLRISLTNRYGTQPLQIAGATIARSEGGATVDRGSLRPLKFDGRTATTIPPGEGLTSDPVAFPTQALESVTVTLYLREPTGPATYHAGANATSYRADGDHRFDPRSTDFDETSTSWYLLNGVHADGPAEAPGTVVAFGDSLTDGRGTALDENNRYPDELAELLAARGTPRPVANLGIDGSKFLVDSPCFGESGLKRFRDQVLTQPGAEVAIVSIGLNDIGSAGWPEGFCGANPAVTAEQLMAAHREVVRLAHEHGLLAVAGTMPPMKGHSYHSPDNERIKDEVNEWIRTSGVYDRVVDFEKVLADPEDPDALNPALDSGDHIHPNDEGRHRMAQAVLAALEPIPSRP
ncbi:SGNH/GDSL hydrolase family protein [Intrasporangium sp.]|uniref:SGNH/GDSL hydrolase family protein n=1 Tax=Intrasporangium sp. TaxID=1925024 RepID=UPI00293B39CA|nr:SGNH/GDSL hydrolase family protein [Intrasporangium sp.]MDV3220290.1 SGNH/GDSL hydrolase family protein [Intrasporangium sp.]